MQNINMANRGRRGDEKIFFVYDHNMLKKEEDDLKDAVLYFYPESVTADDQCALCGQLMGMAEYLMTNLGKACPQVFKLEKEKFVIKHVGKYSLGLQGRGIDPDVLLIRQLDSLYSTFVTYHGSLDSLRLRHKGDHSMFLSELRSVFSCVLEVAGTKWSPRLSQTFQHLPYVDLPKTSSHLFVQASHLLQSSQRRPYVIAGVILYKNRVLCTQLSPTLTQQLTFLQQQMPHISRKADFELPVGCRMITLFLPDEEFYGLQPLHPSVRRHCKGTDFQNRRDSEAPTRASLDAHRAKLASRRLTYPNDSGALPVFDSKPISDLALNAFMRKEQKSAGTSSQEPVSVDKHTWSKNKQNVSLSHVPILECRSGESAVDSDTDLVLGDSADDNHFSHSQEFTDVDKSHKPEFYCSDQQPATGGESAVESRTVKPPSPTETVIQAGKLRLNDRDTDSVKASTIPAGNVIQCEVQVHVHPDSAPTNPGLGGGVESPSGDCVVSGSRSPSAGSGSFTQQNSQPEQEIGDKTGTETRTDRTDIVCDKRVDIDDQSGVSGDQSSEERSSPDDLHVHVPSSRQDDTDTAKPSTSFSESLYRQVPAEYKPGECSEDSDGEEEESDEDREEEEEELTASISDLEEQGSQCGEAQNTAELKTGPRSADPLHPITSQVLNTDSGAGTASEQRKKPSSRSKSLCEVLDGKENLEPDMNVCSDRSLGCVALEAADVAPCISCLELQAQVENSKSSARRCSQCLAKLGNDKLGLPGGKKEQETFDFSSESSETAVTSADEKSGAAHQNTGNQGNTAGAESLVHSLSSSFSSNVSSDSSMSRYWTQEMDGLNDVTLYVQCHSNTCISLMLLMENPVQFQENLLHSLWKSSLPYLADLDYHIRESVEQRQEELQKSHDNYNFLQFDALSHNLTGNVGEVPSSVREEQQHQMYCNLHAEFQHSQCLRDVTLRSQTGCCYGHRGMMKETYFQLDPPTRLTSGLPIAKDQNYCLDNVARQRLARDKNISML